MAAYEGSEKAGTDCIAGMKRGVGDAEKQAGDTAGNGARVGRDRWV